MALGNEASKYGWVKWVVLLLIVGAAGVLIYENQFATGVEVPTVRVERRDFEDTVRARGELMSNNAVELLAPQTPNLTITRLAEDGKPVQRGEVIVEFDSSAQEDALLLRQTNLREADGEITQAEAQHSIEDETNALTTMQSEYNLERAKLEASKQEILSEIQGLKNKIDVTITEGELNLAEATGKSADISQAADLKRLGEKRNKALRDVRLTRGYLRTMQLRAPRAGVVRILPNSRAGGGSFGQAKPPFQEGDSVWTGAAIAEIPDLSQMSVEFRVEEIDRGRVRMGQPVRISVDAVNGLEINGEVEWLSPIATLIFRRFPPDKNFPARATLANLDERLRPGMSTSVEIVVDRKPDVIVIPSKASFQREGKPVVYIENANGFEVRTIEVIARTANEIVVGEGLAEGDVIALENPDVAAKKRG